MPSLFTRARTTSTKNLPRPPVNGSNDRLPPVAPDEFGRVVSRGAHGATTGPQLPSKDAKDKRQRSQSTTDKRRVAAISGGVTFADAEEVEDGFLPTSLAPHETAGQIYGYLSHEAHVVLGVDDVTRLVEVVADELGARGLTTPFLFSNTALDISSYAVRRLISSFLYSVNPSLTSHPGLGNTDFREEARFAGPHDLGMVLRWGLARIVRLIGGVEARGIIGWDVYLQFRRLEQQNEWSNKTEFTNFLKLLPVQIRSLVLTLLTLLARLLAHSTSSGLTPPALSSLFGPLLFGLAVSPLSSTTLQSSSGTANAAPSFHAAYSAYLRSAHATEHVLLSFVRLQVAQTPASSPSPRRLLSWIQGYPAMLAPIERFESPRKGVKIRRVASVRRNVRMYSPDLVRTCAGWARGSEGGSVRASMEWTRITPEKKGAGERMEPRYTDGYRKRMDLPPTFLPQTGLSGSNLSTPSNSTSSTSSSGTTKSSLYFDDGGEFGLGLGLGLGIAGTIKEESKFRSLTDMKWGEFEMLGFGEADSKKLQFDLNESARTERITKRTTLTWADFSAAGFTRTDSSLSDTLQFSPPLTATITQWPTTEKDLQRKLKKNVQKALPPFGWDTAPVMDGREEVIEEGFVDCFCDLIYGGGWMDRGEGTFRECNWALVEFKSLSTSSSATQVSQNASPTTPSADPRTDSTLILFEEFVPSEYRASLLQNSSKPLLRTRLISIPSLLSPGKSKGTGKTWKPAPTLNGRPYVVGAVPKSPSAREADFERMLAGGQKMTKVLTLDGAARNVDSTASGVAASSGVAGVGAGLNQRSLQTPVKDETASPRKRMPVFTAKSPTTSASLSVPQSAAVTRSAENLPSTATASISPATLKKSRFRFPVGRDHRQGIIIPSEYDTVDFETRLASYSDDELNGEETSRAGKRKGKGGDDAWVDILVASNAKRMTDQDAEMRPRGTTGGSRLGGGRSDPELASREVAQALAAARQHPTSDDEGEWGEHTKGLGRETDHREPPLSQQRTLRTPSPPKLPLDDDLDESSSATILLKKKRGLGYFDMHPDRRPTESPVPASVDLATDAHPGDHFGQQHIEHGNMYADSMRDTLYSDGDFEPASIVDGGERQLDGDIEVPAFIESHTGGYTENARAESMTLPSQTSKTAQLIEMYRERERLGQQLSSSPSPLRPSVSSLDQDTPAASTAIPTTAPLAIAPKPSRLPVRASALQKDADPVMSTSRPISDASADYSQESASMIESEADDDHLQHPGVPFGLDNLGRVSPMRYVHGAPLHNVMEEEEE